MAAWTIYVTAMYSGDPMLKATISMKINYKCRRKSIRWLV